MARVVEYIHAGDCFQVNLSQRLPGRAAAERPARTLPPAAASSTPRRSRRTSISATSRSSQRSPERFLRVDATARSRRGRSRARGRAGRTPEEDAAAGRDCCASPKDRAENVMIVDLLRNDLGRVCEIGSVRVPRAVRAGELRDRASPGVEVRGELRAGLDAARPAAGGVPRRLGHRRAEDAGDGDHRRAGADARAGRTAAPRLDRASTGRWTRTS